MTQREIKKAKAIGAKRNVEMVAVTNCGSHMVQLHLRDPGSDFYVGERVIRLLPGQRYVDERDRFNQFQLENLQAKGELTVVSVDN